MIGNHQEKTPKFLKTEVDQPIVEFSVIGIYHCLKDCKVWHLNSCDATQGTKPSVMAGKNLRHPNVNQLHN